MAIDPTAEQLIQIMPHANPATVGQCTPYIKECLTEFEIDTPLRAAAFLAQIAHETGSLEWLREIWGPTPQQRKYDPPNALAKQLGNILKGDGKKFRGRGAIQLTGRANYKKYGQWLQLPLEEQPELAEQPAYAFRIAGAFWHQNNLNTLADVGKFETITRRINGGTNGLAERKAFYARAKKVLQCPS